MSSLKSKVYCLIYKLDIKRHVVTYPTPELPNRPHRVQYGIFSLRAIEVNAHQNYGGATIILWFWEKERANVREYTYISKRWEEEKKKKRNVISIINYSFLISQEIIFIYSPQFISSYNNFFSPHQSTNTILNYCHKLLNHFSQHNWSR